MSLRLYQVFSLNQSKAHTSQILAQQQPSVHAFRFSLAACNAVLEQEPVAAVGAKAAAAWLLQSLSCAELKCDGHDSRVMLRMDTGF